MLNALDLVVTVVTSEARFDIFFLEMVIFNKIIIQHIQKGLLEKTNQKRVNFQFKHFQDRSF